MLRDGVGPLLPRARRAAASGRNNYITLCSHQHIAPAVAKRRAEHALRAAGAHEQDGILLRGVELGRVDYPGHHLLVVRRGHETLLERRQVEFAQQILVHLREVCALTRGRVNAVDLGWIDKRGARSDQFIASQRHVLIILIAIGQLTEGARGYVEGEDLIGLLDRGGEVDRLAVGRPLQRRGTGVERVRDVHHLSVRPLHHHHPLLVCLVSAAAHAGPEERLAIGRELWVLVVARHVGRQEARLLVGQRVGVEVGVGLESIVASGELLTSVDNHGSVGAPSDLFRATKGFHRRVEGFAGHDVFYGLHLVALHVAEVEVIVGTVLPRVPMAVHEIVVDVGLGLVEVLIEVAIHALFDLGGDDEQDLIARWGIEEAFDRLLDVGHLFLGATVRGDVPEFALTQVGDSLAVGLPSHSTLAGGGAGELLLVRAVRVHDVEIGVASVFGDAVVGHRVGDLLAVGRYADVAYATESPEHLGGHLSVLDLHFWRSDHSLIRGAFFLLIRCVTCHHGQHGACS